MAVFTSFRPLSCRHPCAGGRQLRGVGGERGVSASPPRAARAACGEWAKPALLPCARPRRFSARGVTAHRAAGGGQRGSGTGRAGWQGGRVVHTSARAGVALGRGRGEDPRNTLRGQAAAVMELTFVNMWKCVELTFVNMWKCVESLSRPAGMASPTARPPARICTPPAQPAPAPPRLHSCTPDPLQLTTPRTT